MDKVLMVLGFLIGIELGHSILYSAIPMGQRGFMVGVLVFFACVLFYWDDSLQDGVRRRGRVRHKQQEQPRCI